MCTKNRSSRGYILHTDALGVAGRYAGVISGAGFHLDGITYNTSPNGHGGTTTFDGGVKGWGKTSLDIASHTKNSITFVIFERAGSNGFPGTAGSSLTHTVMKNEWRISYGVTPSRTSVPVPINLSNQVFWNLDGFMADGPKTIANHTLHLPYSGLRIDADEAGIPTGDLKGNKPDSRYDFWSRPQIIGPSLRTKTGGSKANGYDDTFLISRPQPWNKDSHPVASLASAQSGIKMEMYTDQEALHLLTWNEPNGRRIWSTNAFSRR